MKAKAVTVADAVGWFAGGWRIFIRHPALWIVLGLIFLVTAVVLSLVPFLGGTALTLLSPVLTAGFLHAAREVDQGRPLQATHVFQGFKAKDKLTRLLALGGIAVLIWVVVFLALIVFIGGPMMRAMQDDMPAHAASIDAGTFIGLSLVVVVLTLAMMALLYATPLVMFRGIAVGKAMRSSFVACARNWLPLLVFGVLYGAVAVLASMPFMLGWLVLLPVTVAMLYRSYSQMYGDS
ncbi:MAG: DUF2189 domain-containing protein [Pseudomonadota bacterium]|nr:MAG: DUF2189 domain-containing protein [Pseudomonadota bacterium]